MRERGLAAAVAAGIFLTPFAAAATSERTDVGSVERVEADVDAQYKDEVRDLSPRSDVLFHDLISTGAKARLLARLRDGTELTLGEHARLLIDEFVYEPDADDSMSVHVITGAFLFVGGDIETGAGSDVEIRTPVGTLGVRGTTVWGGEIDGGYGVLVLDGEVDVRTAGGMVTLKAGEATMISGPDSAPEAPHTWNEEKTARAVATISFTE
jgi:hypothetical protein